jgi:hypothetical protein
MLDLRLFHVSFWARGFPRLAMDGHPQATVVLFPCSLSQDFKDATMGISSCALCLLVCLFVLFLAPQSIASGRSLAYTGLSRR